MLKFSLVKAQHNDPWGLTSDDQPQYFNNQKPTYSKQSAISKQKDYFYHKKARSFVFHPKTQEETKKVERKPEANNAFARLEQLGFQEPKKMPVNLDEFDFLKTENLNKIQKAKSLKFHNGGRGSGREVNGWAVESEKGVVEENKMDIHEENRNHRKLKESELRTKCKTSFQSLAPSPKNQDTDDQTAFGRKPIPAFGLEGTEAPEEMASMKAPKKRRKSRKVRKRRRSQNVSRAQSDDEEETYLTNDQIDRKIVKHNSFRQPKVRRSSMMMNDNPNVLDVGEEVSKQIHIVNEVNEMKNPKGSDSSKSIETFDLMMLYNSDFLKQPISPKLGILRFKIKRHDNKFQNVSRKFSLFEANVGTFVLNAKKVFWCKSSTYRISMKQNVFDKSKEANIGKLKKLEDKDQPTYTVYDGGLNPKKSNLDPSLCRQEVACTYFTKNCKGENRLAKLVLPKVTPEHQYILHGNSLQFDRLNLYYRKKEFDKITFMSSSPDFETNDDCEMLQSVKNTQIPDNFGEIAHAFELYKSGENEFKLNIKYPLSILGAFGAALSIFDMS